MLLFGIYASINGFILNNYIVLPYVAGFMLLNFIISVFINPKFAPINFFGQLIVSKQVPIYIGAIQKRFAWSLGLLLSGTIFGLSLKLISDPSYFQPVCALCMICLFLMFLETAFGICLGCKIYNLSIKLNFIKEVEQKPNCMGNSCY